MQELDFFEMSQSKIAGLQEPEQSSTAAAAAAAAAAATRSIEPPSCAISIPPPPALPTSFTLPHPPLRRRVILSSDDDDAPIAPSLAQPPLRSSLVPVDASGAGSVTSMPLIIINSTGISSNATAVSTSPPATTGRDLRRMSVANGALGS